MRLLFIADGRSSHTALWLRHFVDRGHEVYLISTHPCRREQFKNVRVFEVPIWARARDSGEVKNATVARATKQHNWHSVLRARGVDRAFRPIWEKWLPYEAYRLVARVKDLIAAIQPDLVHALRLPIEGYVAALAAPKRLVLSTWGCD